MKAIFDKLREHWRSLVRDTTTVLFFLLCIVVAFSFLAYLFWVIGIALFAPYL